MDGFLTALSFLPVLVLITLMVKPKGMPAFQALPLSALLVYGLSLSVFNSEATLTHAVVVEGLLMALTPILIISGAIFLFRTLDVTGSMAVLRYALNGISENPVAQLMLVGWAFPFLLEGASGFGTPAALAAPVLVGLGFHPLRVAVLVLVMNSVPVSFGAVGTPTWFGFAPLDLSIAEKLDISLKTALIHAGIAFVIPLLALRQLIAWQSLRDNLRFILLSIAATVLPFALVASVNYEFPSLVGGAVGLLATVWLAHKGIGLSQAPVELACEKQSAETQTLDPEHAWFSRPWRTLAKASFPLWGTLLLLLLTRIPDLGIKALLTDAVPAWELTLPGIAELSVSSSLVLVAKGILGTQQQWQLSLLYVPAIVPFVVIALMTFGLWRTSTHKVLAVTTATIQQMRKPAIAMFGALVFVNLMMMGGKQSMVQLIGNAIGVLAGGAWAFFAPFLGALGAFFSGSATISNLTFGAIQAHIATDLGLNRSSVLALQSVGAALGNMVCINNIVAVASVLGISHSEGEILKRTFVPMLVYATLAGFAGLLWLT